MDSAKVSIFKSWDLHPKGTSLQNTVQETSKLMFSDKYLKCICLRVSVKSRLCFFLYFESCHYVCCQNNIIFSDINVSDILFLSCNLTFVMLLNLSQVKFDGRRVFAKCLFLKKLNFDFNRSLYFFSIFPGILSERMSLFVYFIVLVLVLKFQD